MTRWENNSPPSARELAYQGLHQIFEKDAYANLTLQQLLKRNACTPEDRRFLTELVYGVCRRYNYLLWIIEKLVHRPLNKIDPPIRLLLCLGLYQLIFLASVPDSAAVNETVKMAKKVTHAGGASLVNAVLRSYLRQKEQLALPQESDGTVLWDSLYYNEPEWLVRRWFREWGPDKARSVLAAFNEIAPVDIRCNTNKISTEALKAELDTLGCRTEPIPFYPEGLALGNPGPFFRSKWMKDGYAYIQNRASMVPACLLSPVKGERILDMCAAPGSKTTQVAGMMGDDGWIDAWDLYPHKIRLIQDNCRRLGLKSVHARVQDAAIAQPEAFGRYDRVLLDAPCSGLGVLRRKMELRWRRKESDLAVFPPMQKQLFHCASLYVRPGGTLVYSTCTLNREENEMVVQDFLSSHTDFAPVPFELPGIDGREGWCTLWPDTMNSDGFFAAKLERRPV